MSRRAWWSIIGEPGRGAVTRGQAAALMRAAAQGMAADGNREAAGRLRKSARVADHRDGWRGRDGRQ